MGVGQGVSQDVRRDEPSPPGELCFAVCGGLLFKIKHHHFVGANFLRNLPEILPAAPENCRWRRPFTEICSSTPSVFVVGVY